MEKKLPSMGSSLRKILQAQPRTLLITGLFVGIILCALGLALAIRACGTSAGEINLYDDVASLSQHYQQDHDYQSLVLLIPHLKFQMKRSEVESLLGSPGYCPTTAQCYYFSDLSTQGKCAYGDGSAPFMCLDPSGTEILVHAPFLLTLVVDYDPASETGPSPDDLLSWFDLGPVGE